MKINEHHLKVGQHENLNKSQKFSSLGLLPKST